MLAIQDGFNDEIISSLVADAGGCFQDVTMAVMFQHTCVEVCSGTHWNPESFCMTTRALSPSKNHAS